MGKKNVEFFCRVKGGFSPLGLPKVFFSFVPEDMEQMKLIEQDILALTHCAIYYHEDVPVVSNIDMDDLALKFKEMKLFIIIVTANYLLKSNFPKDWEYGFAIKNHIPVLPIAMEPGLEALFASEMNSICSGYGDIQLLRYKATDRSEISYHQKLFRDLSSILVNASDVDRIKKAFRAQVFLSYRKKDRRYANQLMQLIHSVPSLQNVSIWYDEFISTGEAWNSQIQQALACSDIFLLMVTPSIMEPDNYVIREEYPAARSQNIPIVPAKKASACFTDKDIQKLKKLFPDIQVLVDGDSAEALEQALRDIAGSDASTPEKDYLVGLAFFNGIHVEKDTEKAVSLILASAKKGFPEAINKLADMYWNGDGLEINYEESIRYRKQLIALYEKDRSEEQPSFETLSYVRAMERLCVDLYELSSYRDALFYGMKFFELTSQLIASEHPSEYEPYYSSACDMVGRISTRLGLYDEAKKYFQKYCDFHQKLYDADSSVCNLHDLSVGYERMGDVEYATANYQTASQWFTKTLSIRTEIDNALGTAASAFSLSCTCLVTGDIHIRGNAPEEADRMYKKAVSLRKRILDADETPLNKKSYGEAIISRGTSALLSGNVGLANELFHEAEVIFSELAEQAGTIESWRNYSLVLNRFGQADLKRGEYDSALKRHQKSLRLRKKILAHSGSKEAVFDCALTLYFIAQCYTHLTDKPKKKAAYDEAIEMLIPILPLDKKCDWHHVFAEAAFERFKLDTYSGKKFLTYAINGWQWLTEQKPDNAAYQKNYALCQKIYQRCYPD